VGPLVISLLVVVYYRNLLTGAFPISHDHPAHMFNAWLTSDVLIPSGRLSGWTDFWFAGYPGNELYGPGGNLWVSMFRYLSLGQLDYGTTYGLAIFGLFLLIPLSVYALGRAFVGKTAGLVAGVLMVVTRGGWYDLGWFWILEMGVWPFALGACLTFLSLIVLRKAMREGGLGRWVGAALILTAAVFGHPMSILLLGLCVPLLVLHHFMERGRDGITTVVLRLFGIVSLAVLLASAWLIPFVAKRAYTQKLGEVWMRLDEAMPLIAQLDLFGPEWRLVFAAAIVGAVLALIRRNPWALFFVTASTAMMLLASSTVLYSLRLFDVASPFASIQYPRFLGVVQVFVYLLAGYAIQELVRSIWEWRERWRRSNTRWNLAKNVLFLALPLLMLLPFVPGAISYFRINHTVQTSSLQTQHQLEWWDDFEAAADYVEQSLDGEPWSRVAAIGDPYEHAFAMLPIQTGLPVYTGGYVPAHTYRYFFEGRRDVATLRAVGVRFVIAETNWGRSRGDLLLKESFGSLAVYELKNAQPQRASAVNDCNVVEKRATNERLVFSVTDVKEPCTIRFHRSDYPNWEATLNGTILPIRRISVHDKSEYAPFMSVLVPEDGELTLVWVNRTSDRAGLWLAGLGWFTVILLLLLRFSARLRQWVQGRLPRFRDATKQRMTRVFWAGMALVTLVVIGGAVTRAGEGAYTFDRHLEDAHKYVMVNGEQRDCKPARNEPGWRCGINWDVTAGGLYSFDYDNRYCIYAHPSPDGVKHVTFTDVPLGTRLSGFYGLLDTSQGNGAVNMDITVGEQPPVRFSVAQPKRAIGFEITTEPGTATVDVAIQAQQPNWRQFCFNMQVVD